MGCRVAAGSDGGLGGQRGGRATFERHVREEGWTVVGDSVGEEEWVLLCDVAEKVAAGGLVDHVRENEEGGAGEAVGC